jgi:deoxyribonuclease-4
LGRLGEGVRRALAAAPGPELVIELTAGGSGTIASRWPEAAEILHALDGEPRVRFCFDTCHALAAGYDLTTPEGLRACLAEMRREVGASRLALVHANDSRDPVGSRRDRHWHVGEGTIGLEPFRALMSDRDIRRVPIVIETPGTLADDLRNIARLRALSAGRGR